MLASSPTNKESAWARRSFSKYSTDSYPRALTALWLGRVLSRPNPLVDSILEAIGWALPDIAKPLHSALAQCAGLHMQPRKREELDELREQDDPSPNMGSFLYNAFSSVQRVVHTHLRAALERVPLRPSCDFRRALCTRWRSCALVLH